MNCKECGRKWSWPDLDTITLRKAKRRISQDTQGSDRDSNRQHSKSNLEALPIASTWWAEVYKVTLTLTC
jgi:hypothetical protein